MSRVLIVMFGIDLIHGMFPFHDLNVKLQFDDVKVKVTHVGDRETRSADPSKHIFVSFYINSDLIEIKLTSNKEIQSNVPIYSADNEGNVKIQQISKQDRQRQVRFFQDTTRNRAAFIMTLSNSSLCMTGIFLHQRNEYIIEPKSKDCLPDFGGDITYRVVQLDQRQQHFIDPLLPSMTLKRWPHDTRKRHKRQITDYKIEMFFIIDYAIYEYWYTQSKASGMKEKAEDAKNNIRQFYSFVINGMDVRYKNIQSPAYRISILFSGIYIADTPLKSPFIESIKVPSASGYQVDSSDALSEVTSWVQKTPGLPQHDHAMMFTRYDFTSTGSSDTTGLAWLGTLCTNQAVSVVEDHFNFNVITVAAHELGHGLNAKHDGTGNSCNGKDAYVMAPSTIPVDNQNPWKFSTCSIDYFTTFIENLNRENNNCMAVLSPDFNPGALKQYTALPGEIYDADAHCRHIVGPGSSFCKSIYNQNFTSVCTKLWCTRGDGSNVCVSAVGGDGIQCGNKKWCISGACKSDACAPPGDESCLYGDTEGVAIRYNGIEVTCSFEDIKKNPFICYSVKDKCCRQCRNFFTGIRGCEYGDKVTGCLKSLCQWNPDRCCGTCYNGTLSTPSSEPPTTQKYINPCRIQATTPSTTNDVEGYRNYLIYGGAGAVSLGLLCVICICALYHKRQQKPKSVPNSKLHGFTNRAMGYI